MAAGCSHALFVEGGGAGVCVWLSSSDYCLQTVVGTVDGIGQTIDISRPCGTEHQRSLSQNLLTHKLTGMFHNVTFILLPGSDQQ